MPPPLVVPFTKMNGAGNDFIVLDNRFLHLSEDELAGLARRYCPRRTGVGADGLLALENPTEDEAAQGVHLRMRYRNADGSRATMCGNGARCIARFARSAGIDGDPLLMMTDAGRYRAEVPADSSEPVCLHVPPPRDFAPCDVCADLKDALSGIWRIWTGTEHAVAFVRDVDSVEVDAVGRRIRHEATFRPAGTNANFVEVIERGREGRSARVRARTFEKGVEAETLACGTGALAAALTARLSGAVAVNTVEVQMPGGLLCVRFAYDGEEVRDVTLEGPAAATFTGLVEL
jgi:diaminopimelate epimerase